MTNEQFDRIFDEVVAECRKIHATKGQAYANGADRLANFKREAVRHGLQPETILAVYRAKHEDSINFVNHAIEKENGKIPETGEPLISRFVDVINYHALNLALIIERQERDAALKATVDEPRGVTCLPERDGR